MRVPSLALTTIVVACASASGGMQVPSRPRLRSITPDSVEVVAGNVVTIDLRGSGFDISNLVRIGAAELRAVPADATGTVLRVSVPVVVSRNGEAPPNAWLRGRYPVSVTTSRGTSDTLMLTIVPRGSEP